MIIAVIYATFAVAKRKPEKIQACKVAYITAMIILHLILHSAVHIYDFHIFKTSSSSFQGVYNEPIQRPAPSWFVSLIDRALYRYRTGQGFEYAVQDWIFFRLSFHNSKSCVYNCNDHPSFNPSLRSSHMIFIYSKLHIQKHMSENNSVYTVLLYCFTHSLGQHLFPVNLVSSFLFSFLIFIILVF